MHQLRVVESSEPASAAGDGYMRELAANDLRRGLLPIDAQAGSDYTAVNLLGLNKAIADPHHPSLNQAIARAEEHLAQALHHNQRLLANNAHLHALLLERTHEVEASHHAANHDDLTGLCNRRTLPEHLGQALAHAKQNHQSLALVMLDLNGFRHVNDRFGHVAGDRVLRTLAKRIALNVGALDTVCRYGGDEFVLILPNVDRAAAMRTVETITQQIAAPCAIDGYAVSLSVSSGIAIYPRDSTDAEQLLEAADKAMYRQKPRPGLIGKPKVSLRWFLGARAAENA